MFGNTQSAAGKYKNLMSIKKSIRPLGFAVYDEKFKKMHSNQVELANKFSVNKTTVSR